MDPTQRRQFLVRSLALALLAGGRAEAQPRIYRLAFLSAFSDGRGTDFLKALFGKLEELGYRVGRNLVVERRYGDGRLEPLPALAAELVALNPDLIFTQGSFAALAASKATSTIPIVFILVADPVGMGIVKSLGRPGTNATGFSTHTFELNAKRLQLLKEVFPSMSRVALLYNPHSAIEVKILATLNETSKALGLVLRVVEVKSAQEYAPAFKTLERERPDALYVIESPFAITHRARIVEFANGLRLPAVYGSPEFADAGGLLSYSWSSIDQYVAAAPYIDKILKGAKPADLPVELPKHFELVLNLKTANAQGVKFPLAIRLRADRVIE